MKLNGLRFVIGNLDELTEKEKDILTDYYHKLFLKIYGNDLVDSFSYFAKVNTKKIIAKDSQVKSLAENYNKVLELLDSLKEDANSQLLLIYMNKNLIGSAIIRRIDDVTSSIPYITVVSNQKDFEREIWQNTVSFIEKYLSDLGYKKIYLEIPLKEGPLLFRARELGFSEDPEDIVVDEVVYTYILNKNIEAKNE